jgi:hypothetical protein
MMTQRIFFLLSFLGPAVGRSAAPRLRVFVGSTDVLPRTFSGSGLMSKLDKLEETSVCQREWCAS